MKNFIMYDGKIINLNNVAGIGIRTNHTKDGKGSTVVDCYEIQMTLMHHITTNGYRVNGDEFSYDEPILDEYFDSEEKEEMQARWNELKELLVCG